MKDSKHKALNAKKEKFFGTPVNDRGGYKLIQKSREITPRGKKMMGFYENKKGHVRAKVLE